MSAEVLSTSAPGGARLILEPLSPSAEPRRFLLAPGASARVGRTALSDFVVPEDEQLSGAHFAVEWDGATAALRDLGSATGTLLGGARVTVGDLAHGAWIRAGNTDFRVYHEGHSQRRARAATPATALVHRAIQRRLEAAPGHLYAVLDAARSPRVLELLNESADDHQSLFDGLAGAGLWRVAPYLVKLTPTSSPLLSRLLAEGWGHSFGIHLFSAAPFRDVRRHLRRHLRVEDPDNKPMYFRFYDPRVLRRFLPMASPRQVQELFADVVSHYVVEGQSPEQAHVLRQSAPSVLEQEILRLGPATPPVREELPR
jgi:hypothetical protein